MLGGEKHQAVAAVARLAPVVAQVVLRRLDREAGLLARVPVLGRQQHQAQRAVVGHVRMGREHMHAVEQRGAARELLQDLAHLHPHLALVIEPLLAVLHLAAQVGAGIEPEPRRVHGLVAGAVQVVESIGQPVQRVGVRGGGLARLQAAEQYPAAIDPTDAGLGRGRRGRAAQKDRARDPARRVHRTEPRLAVLQLGGLRTLTVDVFLQHRIPAGGEVVRQLVARAAVVEREAAGQDHQIFVLVLPQPMDGLGHQLQHAARALEAIDGGPVLEETIEHLGVDRIGLPESVGVTRLVGLGRQLGALGDVGVGERAAHRLACLLVANGLEQSPPHDLERLFGGHGLPQGLHPSEGFLQGAQRHDAALAAGLDLGLGQRAQEHGRGDELDGLGEGLHERQVAVEGAARQRRALRELPHVGDELVDQDDARRVRLEQRLEHVLAR